MTRRQGDKAEVRGGRVSWEIQEAWNACDDPWERLYVLAKRYSESHPDDTLYDFFIFVLVNVLGETPTSWEDDSYLIVKADREIERETRNGSKSYL